MAGGARRPTIVAADTVGGMWATERPVCPRCAMVRPALRRRLTPLDAGFLYAERPTQPLHIGFCILYAGPLSRDTLVEAVGARLHLVPRYRQRVVFPPFAVAHPTWEDDPDFDLGHHISEVTLPPPADEQVLADVAGRLFAPMLERSRP